MEKYVSIIGVGELGQCLGSVLRQVNACTLELWDIDKTKVPNQKEHREVIAAASVVLNCVPSWAMRQAASSAAAHLSPGALVVSLAKGLELETHQTMAEVLSSELPDGQPWALFSGPMLAEELEEGLPGAGIVTSNSGEAYEILASLFAGTLLRVEASSDIQGVALAGVLKNVYAIGLGAVVALGFGDNTRGRYVEMACAEMAQILDRLGGQPQTAYGLAGLGDLITTGHSAHSSNYKVGQELAANGKYTITSEGVQSLPSMTVLLGDESDDLPLFYALKGAVVDRRPLKMVFDKVFTAS